LPKKTDRKCGSPPTRSSRENKKSAADTHGAFLRAQEGSIRAAITSSTAAAPRTRVWPFPLIPPEDIRRKATAPSKTHVQHGQKTIPFHCINGSGAIRLTVTSVLATRIGASSGNNKSGSSNRASGLRGDRCQRRIGNRNSRLREERQQNSGN